MRFLRHIIALIALPVFTLAQTSKTNPVDGEGWYSITLKANLPKKWEASIDYEARYWNNLKNYYGSYISLGVNKTISKHLDAIAEYRMAFFADGITFRYTLGGEASGNLNKKASLSTRLLFQNRIQDDYDPAIPNSQTFFWRLRGQLRIKASKKLDMYGSVEPIMEFGANTFVDNWRHTIGMKYKINNRTKIDLSYMYRPDFGKKKYNRYFHVLGFNLSYRLKV